QEELIALGGRRAPVTDQLATRPVLLDEGSNLGRRAHPCPPSVRQHLTAFGEGAENYSPCVVLRTAAPPELPRGQPRALGKALHLRPHDAGIHGRLPDPGAEAAVGARDDALAA